MYLYLSGFATATFFWLCVERYYFFGVVSMALAFGFMVTHFARLEKAGRLKIRH